MHVVTQTHFLKIKTQSSTGNTELTATHLPVRSELDYIQEPPDAKVLSQL